MRRRMRTAITLLVVVSGPIGCDEHRSPVAPVATPQVTPQPPPTQAAYTLTPSADTVGPGGVLSISWTASSARSGDWIGLFAVGAAICDHGWSESTRGATTGTLSLTAPSTPGRYEFRYYLNLSCEEAARSNPVTVR